MSYASSPIAASAFSDESEVNSQVILTGIGVSFTSGDATVEGDAVFLTTGVEASTNLGTATGEPESIYPVTGEAITSTIGTSIAQAGATGDPSGIEITSSTGSLVHTGSAIVEPTGINIQFTEGQVDRTVEQSFQPGNTFAGAPFASDEIISSEALVTGLDASTTTGSIATQTDNIIPINGLEIESDLGTAEGEGIATVDVTGQQIDSQTGVIATLTDNIIPINGLGINTDLNSVGIAAGGNTTVIAPADQIEAELGASVITASALVAVTGEEITTSLPGNPNEYSAEGSTALSTDEAKFGVSSVEFDGTSGQGVQQNIASGFASGDFTSEFWIYSSNIRGQSCTLWDFRISGTGLLLTNSNGQISFFKDGSGGSSPTSILTNDTWHHIAIVRSGSTGNVYVDGNLQITRTIGTDDYSSHTVLLGNNVFDSSGYLSGYIDEYRNSNIVRYSSNFTPPTSAFTPDANTTDLLHFDGIDGSTTIINSAGEPIIITGTALTSVTGEEISSNTNNVVIVASSPVDVTGEQVDTEIGVIATQTDNIIPVTGFGLQIQDGDPVIIANATVLPTGVSMQFSDGTTTVTGSALVTPTGIEISAFVGNMRSTPWANVVTNANNTWTPVAA